LAPLAVHNFVAPPPPDQPTIPGQSPEDDPGSAPDAELLGRFLAGECSEADAAAIRRWLMSNPRAGDALSRFMELLDGSAPKSVAPDATASWQALAARLRDEPDEVAESRPSRPRPLVTAQRPVRTIKRALIGALLVAAAVAAFVWFLPTRDAPAPTPRTYATAGGQSADIVLVDGTRVRVAPGSRLRVAADFGIERRDVSLDGQAFFQVVHDDRRPFTVYAGNASARDLGTAFAVRSYAADSAVQVVVREGVVSLSGVGRLNAGDVGSLTLNGVARVSRHADVSLLLGWVDGKLQFADAPLGQVLADVQRWYGLDVRLAEARLASLPFTGSLADLPPSGVVDQVAITLGLRARREGDRYVLEVVPGRTPRVRRRMRAPSVVRDSVPRAGDSEE